MSQYPLVCGDCFCVKPSPENWCEAAARVIRPREVAHLIRRVPRHPPLWSAAENVAEYLRSAFRTGQLSYIPDPKECDLWCSPSTTFARGGGDCDDLAALAVSILHAMDVEAQLAVGVYCDGRTCSGHAWVEGRDQQGAFLLEATSGMVQRSRPDTYELQYLLHPDSCLDARSEARKAQAQQVAMRELLRSLQMRQQARYNAFATYGLR